MTTMSTPQAPPSQASTTTPNASETAPKQPYYTPVPPNGNVQAGPSQLPQPAVQYAQSHLAAQQAPSPQAQTQAQQNATQAYYMSYPPGAWQNAWQLSGYPYAASGSSPYQQPHYTQVPYAQYQQYQPQVATRQRKPPPKPRSPTPEPLYRHWDEVIRAFLKKVGLMQALRGFEDDMVVLNADWERKSVPGAIGDLVRDLMVRRTRFFWAQTWLTFFSEIFHGSDVGQIQRRGRTKGTTARRTQAGLYPSEYRRGTHVAVDGKAPSPPSLPISFIEKRVSRSRKLYHSSSPKIEPRTTRRIAPSFLNHWLRSDGDSTSIPRVPSISHRARERTRNLLTETPK